MKTIRIGVLMGGCSTEREVSIQSGRAIEAALRRQGWSVVTVDVDRDVSEKIRQKKIDLAIIALHGLWGEDGRIQGLLDIMGIPYAGSGVLASAIGMNKVTTKHILKYSGLPTPQFTVLRRSSDMKELPEGFSLPVVVKPTSQGSTIGVSVVRESGQISRAYAGAFEYGDEVLVEKYIPGHEITASILEGETLPLIEIIPKEKFYNYEAKYTKGMADYIVPAQLPYEVSSQVQALALKAHHVLGCEGYSRVDFRVTSKGEPYILEINTLPGMTETSLLPKATKAAGMDYDSLVVRIVQTAMKKRRVE